MERVADDCFAYSRGHIGLAEALALLSGRIAPVTAVREVALKDAGGAILAEPLRSARDVPGFDNCAMDGFALATGGLDPDGPTRLKLAPGRAAAGHPYEGVVPEGMALRVLTGAEMPAGTDAIVMQEAVTVEGEWVIVPPGVRSGSNRRRRGEDIAKGATLFEAGERLGAPMIGVAAELGLGAVRVHEPLKVAVFSSGDELREPGEPLPRGGVYDANRHILIDLLRAMPVEISDLGILPDDPARVRAALAKAASNHHAIVTSGGASRGDEDHVVRAIEALGRLDFWQIAMKPGRPLAFGVLDGAVFIGLPGNPVAATVCFMRIARTVLMRLAGGQWREPRALPVPAGFAMTKKPGRTEMLRARLEEADGRTVARRIMREGSGILTSLTDADGLVEIDAAVTRVDEGDLVPFFGFAELGIPR